jgi:hypothetical protein
MTQDEIIQIARRSYKSCEHIPNVKIPPEFIERFAKLVAQHEREACAKLCEDAPEPDGADLAERIRARGQA